MYAASVNPDPRNRLEAEAFVEVMLTLAIEHRNGNFATESAWDFLRLAVMATNFMAQVHFMGEDEEYDPAEAQRRAHHVLAVELELPDYVMAERWQEAVDLGERAMLTSGYSWRSPCPVDLPPYVEKCECQANRRKAT